MTKVSDIYQVLCEIAPPALQLDFDNAGFLVGCGDAEVKTVLLALDITDEVITEAVRMEAQLIVSHHPVIFHPLRSVTAEGEGALVYRLVREGLSAVCMHTNLDIVSGGVNDVLLEKLGAAYEGSLDADGCGRFGILEQALPLPAFLAKCKERLIHKNCVVICVSEGIRTEDGKYVSELANPDSFTDAQGYRQLTGTARYLSGIAAKEIGCKARAVEFSTLQRSAAHCASRTDIEEAFECGAASVKAADDGDSGVVSVMIRTSDDPYKITTEIKDVHKIANEVRLVPREWINETGDYVKDEFIRYVRPLIQGHLDPITVDGIPSHLYVPGFHDLL